MGWSSKRQIAMVASVLAASAGVGFGQVDPSGIDFVTVRAVGNTPLPGIPSFDTNAGRGRVDYEYRIGRTEISTAQWAEFYNAAFDRPTADRIPFVVSPEVWGAQSATPTTPGGRRWNVPVGNEMRAVGGITWRTAAIYCNWLHNGKGTDRASFLNGAYDVSTFGAFSPEGIGFTDQPARSAGARFWIPSVDEWMKAAHYDPAKQNPDGSTGGWWRYVHGRDDRAPIYGPAGQLRNGMPTEANAVWGDSFPGFNTFNVPLAAYALTSPWGLLDTSGGTAEWTEATFQSPSEPAPRSRYAEGGYWTGGSQFNDEAQYRGVSEPPGFQDWILGLRVASIPSPGAGGLVIGVGLVSLAHRRRRSHSN